MNFSQAPAAYSVSIPSKIVSTSSPVGGARITGSAWNGTRWVVVALGDKIATSEDGVNWTAQESTLNNTGFNFTGVVWTGEQFIAVAAGAIVRSPDGITWTRHLTAHTPFTYLIQEVYYANGKVFIRGASYNPNTMVLTVSSDHGATWVTSSSFPSYVAYGNGYPGGLCWVPAIGKYLAAGAGDTQQLVSSTDGVNWVRYNLPGVTIAGVCGIAVDPTTGTIVVSTPSTCYYSTDSGVTYTAAPPPAGFPYYLVWTGTEFMQVGQNATVSVSATGTAWSAYPANIAAVVGPTTVCYDIGVHPDYYLVGTWTGIVLKLARL